MTSLGRQQLHMSPSAIALIFYVLIVRCKMDSEQAASYQMHRIKEDASGNLFALVLNK